MCVCVCISQSEKERKKFKYVIVKTTCKHTIFLVIIILIQHQFVSSLFWHGVFGRIPFWLWRLNVFSTAVTKNAKFVQTTQTYFSDHLSSLLAFSQISFSLVRLKKKCICKSVNFIKPKFDSRICVFKIKTNQDKRPPVIDIIYELFLLNIGKNADFSFYGPLKSI